MSAPSPPNEKELVRQLHAGSVEAFTELYHFYVHRMYTNIFKMVKDELLAEEIVQDLFGRLWEKKETFNIEQSFSGYLYRIGQNLVHDFYRNLRTHRDLCEKFKASAMKNYNPVEETLDYREKLALLYRALNTLSPQQKTIYQLCRLEGLSYKEAAEHLGISHFTVKEHLSKASNSVRHYLQVNLINNPLLLALLFFAPGFC